jgi:hypothetical protein
MAAGAAATARHGTPAAGAGFNRLRVIVSVVFENEYDVTVVDTTNWFWLKNRNLFLLESENAADISSSSLLTSSFLDDDSW